MSDLAHMGRGAADLASGADPAGEAPVEHPGVDPAPFIQHHEDGTARLDLLVENLHCAGCIRKVERLVSDLPGILSARVNMTTRRLTVRWRAGDVAAGRLLVLLQENGYPATPFNPETFGMGDSADERRLLACLAVAGFAAANVMLLSVSVWSGHGYGGEAGDMGHGTRTLFHWISALIALPAVAYAGRPFFASAWAALKARRLNMDVPISLAVLLASAMSVQQTWVGARDAYFDAAVTLLFFLLIGRYLDRRARAKARAGAERLLGLQAMTAQVETRDGALTARTVHDVAKGDVVFVAMGERIPVDGVVASGVSEGDVSLVTGETLPQPLEPGVAVYAGTVNLSRPLRITAEAAGDDTMLAEIVRLMEAAEQGRARYVRIADRIAQVYAPAVHLLALITFVGWMVLGNAGWQVSLLQAVAVLIVTCPCALGLAVPVVQVVASGRLFAGGVLAKSADGLERLEKVDHVIFDKTGTLTLGQPRLTNGHEIAPEDIALAAALASQSRHPLSRALVRAAEQGEVTATPVSALEDVEEVPGVGLSATWCGRAVHLGRREAARPGADDAGSVVWLSVEGRGPVAFLFEDALRPDAVEAVQRLRDMGLTVEILSGDRSPVVAQVAETLGIPDWQANLSPADKVAHVNALAARGRKVLMVGDGLNDAPSLSAGYASMSPAAAADISQTAADFVFQGRSLSPVPFAVQTARRAGRLVRQNFALAFLYNAIAVPLAMAGFVTPLVAAIAMSSSSLLVTGNALRLKFLSDIGRPRMPGRAVRQ